MNILKYKGYEGSVELDLEGGVCRGKILFVRDLVTFQSVSIADVQQEFEAAVDDYLETCLALGREPEVPLKGQFNVRIPPALHKAAVLRAASDNSSLNDVVVRALDAFVNVVSGIGLPNALPDEAPGSNSAPKPKIKRSIAPKN